MDDDDDFNAPVTDEDSFNDPDDFSVEPEDEQKHEEFEVLDHDALRREMKRVVESFAETGALPQDVAAVLLRLNGWNKDDLTAKFFENREKVLAAAGLDDPSVASSSAPAAAPVLCPICDEESQPAESYALSCGHWFCRGCWADYIEDKIKQGKLATRIVCPMYKCSKMVVDGTVLDLLATRPALAARFQIRILRSFVEDNRRLRWCPAPRCEYAVRSLGGAQTVTCRCRMRFCFMCNEEAHPPCSCAQLQVWLDKCRNESETAHWIIANTRKCPKCFVRIEKNQGCNHMTCRSCKHEFCWVCMGSWEEHGNHTGGYYKCNKYDPKKKKKKEKNGDNGDNVEEAKAELDRYLHYYQRYHNHDQSKVFAGKAAEKVEQRMRQLQDKDNTETTWIDVQFLKNAQDMVVQCRSVLKYTYVFGYYLGNGPEKELFEFLQQELEKNTENLSELSEKDLKDINRAEVVNFTRITEKFMKNLLEGVDRGLTQ